MGDVIDLTTPPSFRQNRSSARTAAVRANQPTTRAAAASRATTISRPAPARQTRLPPPPPPPPPVQRPPARPYNNNNSLFLPEPSVDDSSDDESLETDSEFEEFGNPIYRRNYDSYSEDEELSSSDEVYATNESASSSGMDSPAAAPAAPAIPVVEPPRRTSRRSTANASPAVNRLTGPASRASNASQSASPAAERQPTPKQPSTSSPALKRSRKPTDEPPAAASSNPPLKKPKIEVADIVNMIDVEDDDDVQKLVQQQMLKSQREESEERRKISDFKCVICLDDPTNLSATSCGMLLPRYIIYMPCIRVLTSVYAGHLFCNDCIKTTLRFGKPAAKFGKCPVCRGKVVIKDIVPLELKLIQRVQGKGKGKA
ncbi:E3 ubiquitin-protein ligase [Drechslerella dactyloides]|uniref:RING-type E3 ubiquitin transferase n=1 Tax=Drechslerella dactyloides TaxID=74499 RepID=A0AAD6NM70_DREDA|nr:E3 ubiquitin-protein ligase [Drechslerella dactyloides]